MVQYRRNRYAEDINEACYLKDVYFNTLEVKGEIKDFVVIVSDKYHEIVVNLHN